MNGRTIAKRVGTAILAVALIALVAVFVVQAVPGVIGAEHSYVVLSNSMAPEINPGDSVIVGDVAPEAIQVDDVITFEREASQPPVTHRVIEVIREDGQLAFRTAGDNNPSPDPGTVPASAVIGQVWFTIPLVGHVVQFANQPAGMAVLIGVPIALFILSELWASGKETTVTRADAGGSADDVLPRFEDREEFATTPAAAESTTTSADDTGGVTIGLNELRLGALGFTSFAIYAAYVAYQDPTGVSVGVAVGAGIAALFHLGGLALFAFAGRSESTDDSTVRPDADGGVHGGHADD